jgi:hypothetical protein
MVSQAWYAAPKAQTGKLDTRFLSPTLTAVPSLLYPASTLSRRNAALSAEQPNKLLPTQNSGGPK